MKIIELINLNKGWMQIFQKIGIRVNDVRYIDLYKEYCNLLQKREKVSYIVAILADKYSISERKVYYLIKLFRTDCNHIAVE